MFKFVVLVALVGLAAADSLDSDVHAEVKSFENDISPEGVFHYGFQSSNGIDVKSEGDVNAIRGGYQYTSPQGEKIDLTYVADAEGYHPSGAHLPTPPPVPEAILRAVQYNLAHPQADEPLQPRKLL